MARRIRRRLFKRKRRVFRGRRRKYYKRNRKLTTFSKVKKFIKYGTRRITKNPYRNFSAQWESGSKIIRTQQLFNLEITRANFNTNLGHYPIDLALSALFTDEQLLNLKNNFYLWKLYGLTIGIKFLDSRNIYKTCNGTGASAIFWNNASNDEMINLYGGFFKLATQQSAAINVDPDSSASNFSGLLETNVYKQIKLTRKPVYWKWYNCLAYSGLFCDTSLGATIGTSIATAFNQSLPDNNQPHGIDIMITNRDRLQPGTTVEEAKIRVQICVYGVVGVKTKKVTDY